MRRGPLAVFQLLVSADSASPSVPAWDCPDAPSREHRILQQTRRGEQAPESAVYLYAHWEGESLPYTLQGALRRGRDRWDDESYLARISFCQMVGGDLYGDPGFGISTYVDYNDLPILVVDCGQGRVGVRPRGGKRLTRGWLSFEEFLALSDPIAWRDVHGDSPTNGA